MKNYIYKVIVLIIAVILIFEFTIGKYLDNFNEKINYLTTKDGRKKMISSIKKEMRKAGFEVAVDAVPFSEKSRKNRTLYLARKGRYQTAR